MIPSIVLSRAAIAATVFLAFAGLPAGAQLAPRTPAAPVSQAPPPPKPLDFEASLKTLQLLDGLSKTLDEQNYGYNARIIKELRDAGVTSDKSFALWLDCKKDIDFDQQGKTMTEYSEWKRGQTKDTNRNRDMELQAQVQWLAIVLMEANARTEAARAEVVAAAAQFLETLVERVQKAEGNFSGLIQQNVLNSIFARHFKVESTVARKDGGAYVPGDVDAIYEKMIFPYYRETKQVVNLINAWKKRIEQQTLIASSPRFKEAKEKFELEKLPELKWGQAAEMFRLGQEEPAAAVMIALIRANMTHRSAGQWIAELRAMLDKKETPKAGNSAGGSSAAEPAEVLPAEEPAEPPPAVPPPAAPPAAKLPAAGKPPAAPAPAGASRAVKP